MCIFIRRIPQRKKGSKFHAMTTKEFIRSRDVVFDEERFHEFNNSEQSSKPNSEQLPFDPFTVQDVADNANPNVRMINKTLQKITFLNQHSTTNQWETYEETFMRNVENLKPQRRRRADDLLLDMMKNCIMLRILLQISVSQGTSSKPGVKIIVFNGKRRLIHVCILNL